MMSALNTMPGERFYLGDRWLLVITLLLIVFGLVMMTSASIEIAQTDFGDVFYHLKRQTKFMLMGLIASSIILMIPNAFWRAVSPLLILGAFGLLVLVLIVGDTRNGSTRWLNLGFMSIQASELAKICVVIFIARLLSEYNHSFKETWLGFLAPICVVVPAALLLLKEPDFGAVVVMMTAVFGMMFLAGAKIYRFLCLVVVAGVGAGGLVWSVEYRRERVMSFVHGLSDPFHESVVYGDGYQLAQSLIAFGRGEWFGLGLGNSIQKINFLPEPHTDFVFAIVAEELGLVAVILLVITFGIFLSRAMIIARKNEVNGNLFSAYMAYGIAFIFTGQVLINIAVNVGLLPTKGLTLPFLSHGGSSLIICMVMVAMLLRIDVENEVLSEDKAKTKRRVKSK